MSLQNTNWWMLVNSLRPKTIKVSTILSTEDFYLYFQDLLNPPQLCKNILYAEPNIEVEMLDNIITLNEVQVILKNLKPRKAAGEDQVPYEYYKNSTLEFQKRLTASFSKIFEEGKIEPDFLKAIITPIHKKGCLDLVNNYRGISLMNSASKIFVGILNSRLNV